MSNFILNYVINTSKDINININNIKIGSLSVSSNSAFTVNKKFIKKYNESEYKNIRKRKFYE